MSSFLSDTIAAIATGQGAGGIGIVRISGPEALAIGSRIFRGRGGRSLDAETPLTLLLGTVVDPRSGEQIDEAFAVHMLAGRSYTGEPAVEIQCHGGRGVLDAVLRGALGAGARPAAPGEFTKRAFLCGRIDLAQAEAVAELISAGTEDARRAALSRLQGALGERILSLRERLLDQIATAETILTHGDEETEAVEPDGGAIAALAGELRELVAAGEGQEKRSRGQTVVIAGRTNSGKSSIFNVLCNKHRSIVSPIPGTTRDYVEEHSSINDTLVTLVDTAGLRDSNDPIEQEGIRRSRARMHEADILVLVIDGSTPTHAGDLHLLAEFWEGRPIVVISKSDLPEMIDSRALHARFPGLDVLALSTRNRSGCTDLVRALVKRCQERESHGGDLETPNLRHRTALANAAAALEEAASLLRAGGPLDLVVTNLHLGLASLSEISGEGVDDEILDRIFSRFCLGK